MSVDNLPHRDSVSGYGKTGYYRVGIFFQLFSALTCVPKMSADSISDKKIFTNDKSWLILINTIPET
jgi:hypothetical protein